MNRLICLGLAVSLGAVACRSSEPASKTTTPDSHVDEAAHEGPIRRVTVPANVAADAGLRWSPATKQTLARSVRLSGQVVADPDHSARISAPIAGRIEAVRFQEGASVKRGDAMVVLRVPDVGRLRGALAATQAKEKAARANAVRLEALFEKKLAAEQASIDATAEANALAAERIALSAQLAGLGSGGNGVDILLRAPIDGTVVARDALVGQPVAADSVLATVADLQHLWFLGRVFEKDLADIHVGAASEITLNAFPKAPFAGVVSQVGFQIDPVARTVVARIPLNDDKGLLRLGLFGTARVDVPGETVGALQVVVRRSAVVEIGEQSVVFVREKDGDFERHDVTLGESSGGLVAITNGVREGEDVVENGAFVLKTLILKRELSEDE